MQRVVAVIALPNDAAVGNKSDTKAGLAVTFWQPERGRWPSLLRATHVLASN